MKKLKQFSRVLLSLIAMSLLWGGQADAASAKAVLKDHFVQMSPVRITNYLKDHHGSNILIPYIQVKSKTAAKTLCAWMPRVRDAFVMAVRSPLKHVSYQKNRQKLDISVVLKQAADRVLCMYGFISGAVGHLVHVGIDCQEQGSTCKHSRPSRQPDVRGREPCCNVPDHC